MLLLKLKNVCRASFPFLLIATLHLGACREKSPFQKVTIIPDYQLVNVIPSDHIVKIPLGSDASNRMSSSNFIEIDDSQLLSMYDIDFSTICVYNFRSCQRVKKIELKNSLGKYRNLKSMTSVYFKSFDSILICNFTNLYFLDSSGFVKDSVVFNPKSLIAFAQVDNTSPPIFRRNDFYLKANPYLDTRTVRDLKKWRLLHQIKNNSETTTLRYQLPALYNNCKYGSILASHYYCTNNRGEAVFSFPADSSIYLTDFSTRNLIYFAQSKFLRKKNILFEIDDTNSGEDITKQYLLSDCYGPIFFDPYRNRYLRVAEIKLDSENFKKKKWDKEHSLIILDSNLKVIGESKIPKNINLYTLFSAEDGLYARIKTDNSDSLFYKKLIYSDQTSKL